MIFVMLLAATLTIASTTPAFRQSTNQPVLEDDDDTDSTLAANDNDPVDTPIDGGLSLLIAAGVGMGVKKVRDGRRKK